jgi:parvulin-like peptidyl-prolyl isomerase
MATVLKIGNRMFTAEEIVPLLASYRLIPQFLCESIVDEAITSIGCTVEEVTHACQALYQQWGLVSEEQRQAWRANYGLSQEQLEQLATRKLRVERFQQATWGCTLESYFLKRKRELDQVIYSLARTRSIELANELYFRLREGEQSFAELARDYSQGAEAHTGGLMGPVELGTLHPNLAELISTCQIGEILPPTRFGEWQVIVRLEKLIPAQLDDSMRQRLLKEKFEIWFQEQVRKLSQGDQIWMGIAPSRSANMTENLLVA